MFVLILLLSPSGAVLADYLTVVVVIVCSNVVAIDYAAGGGGGGGSVVVVASPETRASGTTRRVTRTFFGVAFKVDPLGPIKQTKITSFEKNRPPFLCVRIKILPCNEDKVIKVMLIFHRP